MKICFGIIIYKADLTILLKGIANLLKQSIWKTGTADYKIIILDNDAGCQLESLKNRVIENHAAFLDKFDFIKSENIGFGAGHNFIFNHCKTNGIFDYYFCVNPDGIPHHLMVEKVVKVAIEKENKGIFEALQFPVEHPKYYNPSTLETDWCSGCCVLYPYDVYTQLNGFDDLFFMYMEDVDLSWRARILNYKCYTVNDAYFSHSVTNEDRDFTFEKKYSKISMCLLAAKYSNFRTVNTYLKKLIKHKLITDMELRNLKIKIKSIQSIKSSISDFSHDGYFSKSRW